LGGLPGLGREIGVGRLALGPSPRPGLAGAQASWGPPSGRRPPGGGQGHAWGLWGCAKKHARGRGISAVSVFPPLSESPFTGNTPWPILRRESTKDPPISRGGHAICFAGLALGVQLRLGHDLLTIPCNDTAVAREAGRVPAGCPPGAVLTASKDWAWGGFVKVGGFEGMPGMPDRK
jgi:hypothetical protein